MPDTGGPVSRRGSGSPRSGSSAPGPLTRLRVAVSRTSDARIQGALTILWAFMFIPALIWWRQSVMFLVFVSVYANFVGHLSAWEAAKAKEEAN